MSWLEAFKDGKATMSLCTLFDSLEKDEKEEVLVFRNDMLLGDRRLKQFDKGERLALVCAMYYKYCHPSMHRSASIGAEDAGMMLKPTSPYLNKPWLHEEDKSLFQQWLRFCETRQC